MKTTVKKTLWGIFSAIGTGLAVGIAVFFMAPVTVTAAVVSGVVAAVIFGAGYGVAQLTNNTTKEVDAKDEKERKIEQDLKQSDKATKESVGKQVEASPLIDQKVEMIARDLETANQNLKLLQDKFDTHVMQQEQINLDLHGKVFQQKPPSFAAGGLVANSVFSVNADSSGDVRTRTTDLRM